VIRPARTVVVVLTAVLLLCASGCGASGAQAALANTSWKLTGWAESSPPPSNLTMTTKFGETDLNGSGGINNYSGTYDSDTDGTLSIKLGPMTLMGGPEADMKAETTFVQRLDAASGYRIDGNTLVLTDAEGADSLTYTRA
jgi:heat shock protein HslJ